MMRLSEHGIGTRMRVGDLITSIVPTLNKENRQYLLILAEELIPSMIGVLGFKILSGDGILMNWDVNYAESYYMVVKP